MKILLTGGAGFIGSNLLKKLNRDWQNSHEVIVFDSMTPAKVKNVAGEDLLDYIDKDHLLSVMNNAAWMKSLNLIIHLGATSSTTCTDKSIIENNYRLSKDLISVALEYNIPIIYASSAAVYGNTQNNTSCGEIKPLNMYGLSKAFTDRIVERVLIQDNELKRLPMIVGLRFYNVYGPGESHKGSQASVIYNWYKQFKHKGWWDIFEGENRRDFVHVDDIVNVIMFFVRAKNRKFSGIYDVGTGIDSDFADISNVMMDCLESNEKPKVVPIPDSLKEQYQTWTRADLDPLREIGYTEPFTSLRDGVCSYLDFLKKENP